MALYGAVAFINNKWFQDPRKPFKLPFSTPSIIIGVIFFTLLTLIFKIGGQDIGVKVTPAGVSDEELTTGWHIVMPWVDVYKMDKTVWVYSCSKDSGANGPTIWAPTADGIKMGIDISASWRIDPEYGSWIYSNVSENDGGITGKYLWLEENVIKPKLKSALALTVSQFNPIQVYSDKRQYIQDLILEKMRMEISKYHLICEQIDVREVFYNSEYEKAIDAKKLAEQRVLELEEITRQKNEELKQSEIDKNIAIQRAQGEAESLKIKGAAINSNPKIVDLEWIAAWKAGGSQVPNYIAGNGGNSFLLNLKDK